MKKLIQKSAIFLIFICFNLNINAQIGGVFTVPGNFPTIAAAINTLNTQGVAAAVTINIAAGYTETAIPGGYRLYEVPGSSSTNSVVFAKSGVGANPIVYAYGGGTATSSSLVQDGVWWFVGADYITVDAIDIVDQNTTLETPMEFGFVFFKASATNGCQYNTIKNCAITLNRNNNSPGSGYMPAGCKGIMVACSSPTSNTSISAPTTSLGSNSYNRFYSNSINDCTNGICLYGYSFGTLATHDLKNDIGGFSSATGNSIINFGGAGIQAALGIYTIKQQSLNVAFNVINNNNGSGVDHPGTLYGILNSQGNDMSVSITSNTLTLRSSATTSQLLGGIVNQSSSSSSGNTITISKNVFPSYTYTTSIANYHQIISNEVQNCTNLRIDSNFIGNVALGSGTLSVIRVVAPRTTSIRSNTITNISGGGELFNGITYTNAQNIIKVNDNLIENVTWSYGLAYNFYGIYGSGSQQSELMFNTLRNFAYSNKGSIMGICEISNSPYKLVNSNEIYNFANIPGGSGYTYLRGIRIWNNSLCSPSINSNSIYSLSVSSNVLGTSAIFGLEINGGTSTQISKNKFAAFYCNDGGEISGITLNGSSGSANFYVNNNVLGELGNSTTAIGQVTGLSLSTGICSLYYNTFNLNVSASSEPNFSSTVIRHEGTSVLRMNNNILMNTSVYNGTGKTRVYHRVSSVTNYSLSSNNNLFYAGVPSANNILYDDATNTYTSLSSFKSAVSPREAQSVTENPPFITTVPTATNYLNIDATVPTQVEGLAQPISGYLTDYVNTTRNTSTPDIGAWEGDFLQADIAPPIVVASGFDGGDCSLTGRTFTAQLTDASGIATGSLAPRLYHRLNLGLYTSVQGTLTSGTVMNGVWSFDLTYTANTNDVIRYFFAAQDVSYLSNYSVFPSAGSTSSDVNNVLVPPSAPYTYTIMTPVNVTVNSGIVCVGSSYTLTPSGATSYTFSGGSDVVTPTSNATYTVTGTGIPGCVISNSAVASISVVALPTIGVNSGTTCSNESFTINPSGALSYSYEGGSAIVNPSVTTSYSVVGVDLNGCLSNTILSSVTVFSAPVINVNAGTICEGSTATITALGATTYTWDSNAGGGNVNPINVSPTITTQYTVSGSNADCSATLPFTIQVNPIPVFSISASGPTLSCSSLILTANTNTGNTWTQKAGFSGNPRQYAIAFSVGNKGYIGLGYNTGLSPVRQDDLWEYNVTTGSWTQKANFGGGQRYHAIAFAIGSKGYVGLGLNGSANATSDFWEYDPATNIWTQKSNFGGGLRSSATGFSIGDKGYVGAGYSSTLFTNMNDFWEYDPSTDTWTQKTNFPGAARSSAAGFSIGNKGYMGIGNVSSSYVSDFYEYDPAINSWTSKAPYGMGAAGGVVAFSLGNRGYFATGYSSSSATNQTWEYNPVSDTWTQRAVFGSGYTRVNAVAFTVGLKAFIVTGLTNGTYMSDLWQYDPITTILWSNNITQKTITPLVSGNYSVVVTNVYNCSASATQSVGIQTYPTVSVTNSGGFICGTGSRTLTASGASNYTWSANLGNSNAASVVITPTASTIYTVSSANGWCVTKVGVTQDVVLPATQSIVVSGASVSCGAPITLSTAATSGNIWTQKTGMSVGRSRGVSFSITDKGYVGTGSNGSSIYLNDFWEYDPATDAWTQKANFGGSARYGAVGLSIGGSGFVGTGYDGSYKNDFWLYDPVSNTWTQKNNFGGNTRRYGTSFVINGKAYIGTGQSQFGGAYVDLWEYDPASDSWLQKTSLGIGLYDAVGFSIGNKGYICTGADASGVPNTGLREFDPSTNAWTTKTSITSQRMGAAAFSIGSRAYVTGGNGANDVWEYNPTANVWTAKATFAGPQRLNAVTFVIGNKGYIATGGTSYLSDLWEYDQGYAISWTGAVTSPSLTATSSGNYSLSLTDTRGCSTVFNQSLTITPGLTILVNGTNSACLNSPITLTATGAANYTWSANAGSAVSHTVSVNPSTSAVYTVNAAVGSCTATTTKSVTVYSLPTVLANVSSPTLCAGMPLTLNGAGASSYSWTGGVIDNTAFSATTSTSYTVTGTDINGCSNTATTSVTVNPSPTVSVNSGTICEGQSYTMTPNGGLTYTYTGSGLAIVSPTSTSTYSVTGFAPNGCYNVIPAVSTVSVYARPIVNAPNGAVCLGGSFTMSPTGAFSYVYSSGTAIVSPTSTAAYSITGTSSQGCLSATAAVVNVTVNPIPTITVTGGTVCAGQSFTLSPSGANSYNYSGGSAVVAPLTNTFYSISGTSSAGCASTISAVANITVLVSPTISVNSGTICSGQTFTLNPNGGVSYTYSGSGATVSPVATSIYTVGGFGSNGCPNSSIVTSTVTVFALPVVTVSSGAVCIGKSFTLSPGGALNYVYSGGSAIVSPLATTSYSINGTDVNGCTSAAPAIATITVNSLPNLSIGGSTSVCQGSTQVFTVTGASTYTWNNGSNNNTFSVMPITAGTYSVAGTDLNGCTGSAQTSVNVIPLPTISLSGNTLVCSGQAISLLANGTATTYLWSNGSTGTQIMVSPVVTTVFTATGSNISGCAGTGSILVFVNSLPSLFINSSSSSICSGGSVTLVGSGANTYAWSGGVNNNVAFYPVSTNIYTLTGTDVNNCSNTATTQVVVNPLPIITIAGRDTVCDGETVVLTAGGANVYSWSTGETSPTISVTLTNNSSFSLTGTDLNNCQASSSRTLVVVDCTGLQEFEENDGLQIYPNPTNGLVAIRLNNNTVEFEIEIYNSLSQLLQRLHINEQSSYLDLTNYANGIYFVKISRHGHLIRQEKIIKAD